MPLDIDSIPSSLTRRLLRRDDVVWRTDPCLVLVAAKRAELLVSQADYETSWELRHRLLHDYNAQYVGCLLDDDFVTGHEPDWQDWRKEHDVAVFALRIGDAITATLDLRQIACHGSPARVSPNHLAVPCPWFFCPGGPPTPTDERLDVLPFEDDANPIEVVVIDSGYITHDDLGPRVVESRPGQHLRSELTDLVSPREWVWPSWPGNWEDEPEDEIDGFPEDGVLDAIAGHGTFVAGLIASRCRTAKLRLVGHHHLDSVTEEISVARSIIESASRILAENRDAHLVIHCGVAIGTLECFPSLAFRAALDYLYRASQQAVVVAPAGNETLLSRHWPAAFSDVVGVGALDDATDGIASFSNRGDWVNCFAVGTKVRSTHVKTDDLMPAEEDPNANPQPQQWTGWSVWDGTSFATPKVTAEIANMVASAGSPWLAWAALAGRGTRMPNDGPGGTESANLRFLG
jgi:hypothetical protein